MANTEVRCSRCGAVSTNPSGGFCTSCGATINAATSPEAGKPTLFIYDMAKSDHTTVIILAVITLIFSIISIALNWNYQAEFADVRAALDQYGTELQYLMPDEYNQLVSLLTFVDIYMPIFFTVNFVGIVNCVLLIIKFRPAYKIMIVLYIAGIVLTAVEIIFLMCNGIFDDIVSSVISIVIKVSLIKFFGKIVMAYAPITHSRSSYSYSSSASYSASSSNPVGASMQYIGSAAANQQPQMQSVGVPQPVNSQNQMQSVGVPQPVNSQNQMQSAGVPQPVNSQSQMQSAGASPITLEKPASKGLWQCRGCGVHNKDSLTQCELCGTKRE